MRNILDFVYGREPSDIPKKRRESQDLQAKVAQDYLGRERELKHNEAYNAAMIEFQAKQCGMATGFGALAKNVNSGLDNLLNKTLDKK